MTKEERREKIVETLKLATTPVSASALAKALGVSRQVIVGDIALLRAEGKCIESLARGYQLQKSNMQSRVFKVKHSDKEVSTELNLIVDLGGWVKDVFVYHKVYGTVSAPMDISSRHEVARFLTDIKSGKSSLLKNVTAGYHYHTVLAESSEVLDNIEAALKKAGFLAPLKDYEPEALNIK